MINTTLFSNLPIENSSFVHHYLNPSRYFFIVIQVIKKHCFFMEVLIDGCFENIVFNLSEDKKTSSESC